MTADEPFRPRLAHVARRRADWEAWQALSASARQERQRAFQADVLAQLGPFRGITTGEVQPGLFSLVRTGIGTGSMQAAARDFVESLQPEERSLAYLPVDAPEWRLWVNSMELRLRHGVFLEDLDEARRQAALELLRASLSPEGFDQVRDVMRLNRVLGEIGGDTTILNEWRYFLTIFGRPAADAPWGWQLDGHHLNVNCFVLGDQVVLTPCFMGAEPRFSTRAPFPDARAFEREQRTGLELIGSLSAAQREQAILFSSLLSRDLPEDRRHPTEGRMQAGALRDNVILPYEGISADRLTAAQRSALLELVGCYVAILPNGHGELRRREIEAHLDQTHFAWIGAVDDHSPFFYKVQSPVLLIEFDHHPGVFLDNVEPERFHAHSVVRTPNGNDYGRDLLRQHLHRMPHL